MSGVCSTMPPHLVKFVRFAAAVWVSLLLGEWIDLGYFSLCTNLSKNRKNHNTPFERSKQKNLGSFGFVCLGYMF